MAKAFETAMSNLDAALEYASQGWPVLPVRGKLPLINAWPERATNDQATIIGWFTQWPQANIGIATGHAFDALDIDGPIGLQSVKRVMRDDPLPDAPISITGRGWHLLYEPTGLNGKGFLPHVDWKGIGGMIVVPPSKHQSGRLYQWAEKCGPSTPVKPAPSRLVKLVAARDSVETKSPNLLDRISDPSTMNRSGFNPDGLIRTVIEAKEGGHNRNNALNWATYRLAREYSTGKFTGREASMYLNELIDAARRNGQTESSCRATVKSAWRKGLGM